MATQSATVGVLQGKAWARAADGSLRELAVGDVVAADERLVTEVGTLIELDFGDGAPVALSGLHDVAMSPDLWPETATSSEHASVLDDQFDAILASLDENDSLLLGGDGDLLDILDEAPAAGQSGSDGGHDFVQVERINNSVEDQSFEFGIAPRADNSAREQGDLIVNNAPTAQDQSLTTGEDTSVIGQISAQDIDGDSLTYTLTQPPANGTVTLNPSTGEFEYTPNPDFNGTDEISVTVSDGTDSAVSIAQIEVLAGNDAPVAQDQTLTTPEDIPLSGQVDASDIDLGDTLTYTLEVPPTHGSVTIDPETGAFTYTPAENYNGPDEFTVVVIDSSGASDTAIVELTVTPVNDAPNAIDDGPLETSASTTVTGNALNNDSDVDADNLQVISFSVNGDDTAYTPGTEAQLDNAGVFGIDTNGEFYFTPAPGYSGPVPDVSYTISDGSISDSAVISFDDVPAPSNPTPTPTPTPTPSPTLDAVNDSISVNEDASVSDTVAGNDALGETPSSFAVTSDVSNGTLVFAADGSYTYTPDANFNGSDSFSYSITDADGQTDTATVSITVNPTSPAIDAVNDSISVKEDASVSDTVAGNDALGETPSSFAVTSDVSNGTLVFAADGSYTYTPDANFNGSDSFSYSITDADGQTDTATVSITVNPLNDAPIIDVTANDFVEGDVVVAGSTVAGTYSTDDLGDGDTLTISFNTPSPHYTLDLVNNQVLLTQAGVDVVDNGGALDAIDLIVTDDGSPALSGTDSDTPEVTAVNDAPIAVPDASVNYTLSEGAALSVNAADGVLTNDIDLDGDSFVATEFAADISGVGAVLVDDVATITTALGGEVTLYADGSFDYVAPATVDHSAADVEVDSFAYRVSDGLETSNWALVEINVTDTAPVAEADNDTVNYSGAATGNVISGASGDGTGTDTLGEDSASLSSVIFDGQTYDLTDLDGSNNWVINADSGQLTINVDGSYSYQSVASSSPVTLGSTAGNGSLADWSAANLYGFSTATPFAAGGSLLLTNANAAILHYDNYGLYINSPGGSDDPDELDSNALGTEAIVIDFTESADQAQVTLTDVQNQDGGNWIAYDTNGNQVATGSFNGTNSVTINPGVDFQYLALTGGDTNDDFNVRSVTYTPAPVSAEEFTYQLTDSDNDSSSAVLTITHNTAVGDYDEEFNVTENQDITAGSFNLLDNTSPVSGSGSISSVSEGSIWVGGVDVSADFTFTPLSTSAGEVIRYELTHNESSHTAELTVNSDGDLTFVNQNQNLFDFLTVGEDAEIRIDYQVTINGVQYDSTATVNVAGLNDAPVANPDTGVLSGGFASEFWVYNQGVDGPNLSTIAQVVGFTGGNTPDATFISTGFDYSVDSSDSDYSANLGSGSNLELWLSDNGDDSSIVRNTTESSGDAIVRFTGIFDVTSDGFYDFNIRHDDGFVVYIDGQEAFVADFITSPSDYSDTTYLTAGSHDVEIYYWDQGGEYVFNGSLFDASGNDVWTSANLSYRGSAITTNEDSAITINVLANDTDVDGDILNVASVSNGNYGTVTTDGNVVVYTPNNGFFGQDSFTYTVTDNNGGTDTIAVPVEVRPANNLPVIDLDADDSSRATNGGYVDAGPSYNPLPITDADLVISDLDGSQLFSAQIQILNPEAGDLLVMNGSLPGGINFVYNAATATATLGGMASHADYITALKMVGFDDNGTVTGARDISISIYDGSDQSASVNSTIYVTDGEQLGNASNNVIDTSNWGGTAALTLKGFGGDDNLRSGDYDDVLIGGAGDDTLAGDAGNDVLIGGLGADTFEWSLGDASSTGSPAMDVVLDFSTSEGDTLDLSDLLQSESLSNITDYLHVESDGTDTVIHISQLGNFDGDYASHTSATDQVITLEGVDLSGIGAGTSDEIINYLINGNHLSIDQ
ncbi:retention module-containing protein [Gilvimarinus polysaccharolyticus]|uniref:retention module-containing protein n=1 Tax=Gilvimarinus polysaccharolyticus TaxID=863921 RepID=UPI0006738A87|nr:retention module-containing protein [Gilvimarinus polysaccharolyticus]